MPKTKHVRALHILHIEAAGADSDGIEKSLAGSGLRCRFRRVGSETELKRALAGERFDLILFDFAVRPFDGTTALKLARQNRDNGLIRSRFASLTPRERQIMPYVAAGLMNKQIAAQIGTAEITVKIHRGRIMRKMRAATLPDLVRMAEKLRL